MRLWIIAFLCGDLLLQQLTLLPRPLLLWLLVLILLICYFLLLKKNAYFGFFTACLIGFAWAATYASLIQHWKIPKSWENKPVKLSGYIASIPNKLPLSTHSRLCFITHSKLN